MKKQSIITILLLVSILAVAGYVAVEFVHKRTLEKENNQALQALVVEEGQAGFTDLNGNNVKLNDYLGDILVVNSWASWCPFCVAELNDFAKLANEYADSDVHVLAINRKESKEQAQRFMKSAKLPENKIVFLLDPDDRYYEKIGGFGMPETVFYDKDGVIFLHKRGPIKLDEMREVIELMKNND
ncbi:TlpA family protein disulfide reductase [Candidatus Kaiserbacteria bacterium]|nr:TlpA family protein disulfide reductase [Candidatus Kaiserbacteria bacterium]